MKVLIVPNNIVNNCFGVRNALPKKYLEAQGHEVRIQQEFTSYIHPQYGRVIDPTPFEWADVIVFNRHYDIGTGSIINVIKYAKSLGKTVVYETDDLLERLDSTNPMYQDMLQHVDQVRSMAREANCCTTTGKELQAELEKFNDQVHILPNCVDLEAWSMRKGGNKRLRVGWAGGSSHAADLMIVVEAIKRLKKELDFDFVIFGLSDTYWPDHIKHLKEKHIEQTKNFPNMRPADWYKSTMALAEALEDLEFEHIPFVPHDRYNKALENANLDIGICPLVDTVFNRCKSAIKFYEYAMVGTACLASKIPPYEPEVGCYAKNKFSDWHKQLKRLITDHEFRNAVQQTQRAWVIENRDINKQGWKWEAVYEGRGYKILE